MSYFKPALSIAATAAVLALGTAAPTTAAYAAKGDKLVPCYGVNDCKGQNDCKAHGFKDLSKAQCAKAGGSLKPAN